MRIDSMESNRLERVTWFLENVVLGLNRRRWSVPKIEHKLTMQYEH